MADVVDGPAEIESLALYNGQRTVLLSVQKSQGENTIAVVDGLQAALKDADFIKKQEALGAVVVTDGRLAPAEHKKFVAAEIDKWGVAIKAAGQYAD